MRLLDTNKFLPLMTVQVASLILLMLFVSGYRLAVPVILVLLASELLLLYSLKDGTRKAFFIWQFQFVLVIIVGLIFEPTVLFNTQDVPDLAPIIMLVIVLAIEAAIVLLYVIGNRFVENFFKGATLCMVLVVVMIVALIGSEGLQGFMGSSPGEMLTSTEWYPVYNPDVTQEMVMDTTYAPYAFTVRAADTNVHMSPGSNRSIPLTISNIGALDNRFLLSTDSPSINAVLADGTLEVGPGESRETLLYLDEATYGDHQVIVQVEDRSAAVQEIAVNVHVSDLGFDFSEEAATLHISGSQNSYLSVPLSIINTGVGEATARLRIEAPSLFVPYLIMDQWDHGSGQANVTLGSEESVDMILIPGFVTSQPGVHNITLTAYDEDDVPIDAFILTIDYENVRLGYSLREDSIPLVQGSETKWAIQLYSGGMSNLTLDLVDIPDGLSVVALLDGTERVPVNGPITIHLNNGRADVDLLITPEATTADLNDTIVLKVTSKGTAQHFGLLGFISGTALVATIALLLAVPVAVGSAVFLAEYCPRRVKNVVKPIMEILAGIPSVVFGLWGALTFGPMLSHSVYPAIDSTLGQVLPFFSYSNYPSNTIMTASIVLAIMILPIIMSLSYDAIAAVPRNLKDASLATGASKWQTIRTVVLRKARSGLIAAVMLGLGRALGETMAVLMIMGSSSKVPGSVFESGGTLTTVIASSFNSTFSDPSARHGLFAAALLLFLFVFILNLVILSVSKGDGRPKHILPARVRAKAHDAMGRVAGAMSALGRKHEGEDHTPMFSPPSRQHIRNKVVTFALVAVSMVSVGAVLLIMGDVVLRGGVALHLHFFTEVERAGGTQGGFLNSISGSLILVGIALSVAGPLAILSAIYTHEFASKDSIISRTAFLASNTLASTPSIVFGAFGFMLFILYLDFGFSALAGGLTLACMVLPIIYVSSLEAMKAVPDGLREASLALGVDKWRTVQGVVLPAAMAGVTSGIVLSIGRAIGETAAVLLTAGYATYLTTSIFDPAASMPNMIYQYYDISSGNPELGEKLYAASFILISIVLVLNLISRLTAFYSTRKMGSQ
jgi:phosphate transport system permease protein